MILKSNKPLAVILDLDDTIYKEVSFLKSAYRHISALLEEEIGENIYSEMLYLWYVKMSVFDVIKDKYTFSLSIKDLVFEYRYHKPNITLPVASKHFLEYLKKLKVPIGLITDGRSKTQRNKILALGLHDYFDEIVISEELGSEKPAKQNYLIFHEKYPKKQLVYIGDNINKDFICPNSLKWTTIGIIDDGENIHSQNIEVSSMHRPQYWVSSLKEIKINGLL